MLKWILALIKMLLMVLEQHEAQLNRQTPQHNDSFQLKDALQSPNQIYIENSITEGIIIVFLNHPFGHQVILMAIIWLFYLVLSVILNEMAIHINMMLRGMG